MTDPLAIVFHPLFRPLRTLRRQVKGVGGAQVV